MGKVLVVAEKPSVARDIARVLGCTNKGDSFLYNDEYVVSWAIGHLVTLCEPDDYDSSYKKWRLDSLPIIPTEIKLKAVKKTEPQLRILKKLMNGKDIDCIVCATDSGREGELIFRYIYDFVKCRKKFRRLWISSMTDASIREGFANLKNSSEYDNLYLSAKSRSEADWLVGINASRVYTIKYNVLLSIGRVQTPTLAVLVARQKEINSFVAKDYWEIECRFILQGSGDNYTGLWFDFKTNESKIFDYESASLISDKVRDMQGVVFNVHKEQKKQPAPLLYDLTELQRDCNKKFGFSAQKTLSIAQELYEKRKAITYPRTDSRFLTEDYIPKLYSTIKKLNIAPYDCFVEYICALSKLPISKRIVDNSKVSDHHAIIPTESNIKITSLSSDEFVVYDLIVRRFLAVFYPNYIYNVTKITTLVADEYFLSKGSIVVSLGWMELYRNFAESNKEDIILPQVVANDKVDVSECNVLKKKTKPPKFYTEATLLSAMENAGRFVEDEELKEQLKDSGLGTPATRAAIIERLLTVGYVQRRGKTLIPTEKGIKIIDIVPPELKSPETTGKWEKGLSSIAKGKMKRDRFMGSIERYIQYIIKTANETSSDVVFENDRNYSKKYSKKSKSSNSRGSCPLCNKGEIYENTKAFFCTQWKDGCKFTIWKNSLERHGYVVTASDATQLLKNKKINDISVTLPQTGEAGKADIILKSDMSGQIELINFRHC